MNEEKDNMPLYAFALMVCIVGLYIFYIKFQEEIFSLATALVYVELIPFAWLEKPKKVLYFMKHNELDSETIKILLNFAGSYFRWIASLFMLLLAFLMVKSNLIDKYKYKLTALSLIKQNASFIPALRPVADLDILALPTHEGAWAIALTPIDFCIKHELLLLPDGTAVDKEITGESGLVLLSKGHINEHSPCLSNLKGEFDPKYALSFNDTKAREVFIEQLGLKYTDQTCLKEHELALATAFMAIGIGEQKIGQDILDFMSTNYKYTCIDNKINDQKITIPPNTQKVFLDYINKKSIQEVKALHGTYIYTFIGGLLEFARKKGIVACSEFIWLRPYDRTLWYTLNQLGGACAWSEASGAWSHRLFEKRLGFTEEEPQVDSAIEALKAVLQNSGWLPLPKKVESVIEVKEEKRNNPNMRKFKS